VRWGGPGVRRSIKLLDTLTRNHPPRPHLYLNILGVEPSFQGRHCGIAILNHLRELVEARSDLDGVYLETATEANVAYCTRNGFELIGEFYPRGLRMWRMFAKRRVFSLIARPESNRDCVNCDTIVSLRLSFQAANLQLETSALHDSPRRTRRNCNNTAA
jgi:hypothetical protein